VLPEDRARVRQDNPELKLFDLAYVALSGYMREFLTKSLTSTQVPGTRNSLTDPEDTPGPPGSGSSLGQILRKHCDFGPLSSHMNVGVFLS